MNDDKKNPFASFWMAGFECTDKLNAFGNRVDFLSITGHINYIDDDYKKLHQFNLTTVREGIRWSKVETSAYKYNWSEVGKMIEAGKRNHIQQVWDLCHFGFPDDITPLHPMFARRFVSLCKAFVQFYRSVSPYDTLIVTPINEVGFLSWLGGEARGTSPYCVNLGWEVKYKLMQAYIEGVEALREADPSIRILSTEPLVNMVPPLFANEEQTEAAILQNEYQFQVTDILCGKMCPELRGKPEYLDIIGLNYYYNNQWITGTTDFLIWTDEPKDLRWKPLNALIKNVYNRYERPVVLSETSHPLEDRPLWIEVVTNECFNVVEAGIPFWGICFYPVIDRPDWDNLTTWHHSGLWDIEFESNNNLKRILHKPSAIVLLNAQKKFTAVQKKMNALLQQ